MRRILARLTLVLGIGVLLGSALLPGTALAAPMPSTAAPAPHVQVVPHAAGDSVQLDVYNKGRHVGFVALTTNPGAANRQLEVCTLIGPWTRGQVNPADANGNATGEIIDYYDYAGGGCYVRDLGYPIRKFRAEWDDGGGHLTILDWALPPAL